MTSVILLGTALHTDNSFKQQWNGSRTTLCDFHFGFNGKTGGCKKGDKCGHAHSKAEADYNRALRYSQKVSFKPSPVENDSFCAMMQIPETVGHVRMENRKTGYSKVLQHDFPFAKDYLKPLVLFNEPIQTKFGFIHFEEDREVLRKVKSMSSF